MPTSPAWQKRAHFRGKPAVPYRMLPIRRILAARHRNIAGRVTAIHQPHIRASMRQAPTRVPRRLLFLLLKIAISGGLLAWVLFAAVDWRELPAVRPEEAWVGQGGGRT